VTALGRARRTPSALEFTVVRGTKLAATFSVALLADLLGACAKGRK